MKHELVYRFDQGDDARRRLRYQLLDVVPDPDPEHEEIAHVDDGNGAELVPPAFFPDESDEVSEKLDRDGRQVAVVGI